MRDSFDWNDEAEMKELRELVVALQAETQPPSEKNGASGQGSPGASEGAEEADAADGTEHASDESAAG
jgi:hypothetical protein